MNRYLQNIQTDEIENMERLKSFRHDMLNHISVVKMYIEMGYTERGLRYINRVAKEVESSKCYKITGNIDFDIILSSKITKIQNLGTNVEITSNIPKFVKLEVFDTMTILGNLLDNVYEALLKTDKKRLSLNINLINNNLYIFVSNTYNNDIVILDDKLSTSKKDKENHGIGLNNVKRCVERNNGTIKVTYDDSEFFVAINLPL